MTIEKQVEILNQITQVMHDSAESIYEEMRCKFDYFIDEGDWSVDSEFSFVRNGEVHRTLLADATGEVYKNVHQLHELMKSHTGGDWKSFVLAVDPSGKAKTNFTQKKTEHFSKENTTKSGKKSGIYSTSSKKATNRHR